MITPAQARQIVIDCIDEVSNSPTAYASNKRLGQFAIISDHRVRAFAREVGGNDRVGVEAYGHTLPAKELIDISSETITGDIEAIIVQKATAHPSPAGRAPAATRPPTRGKGPRKANK